MMYSAGQRYIKNRYIIRFHIGPILLLIFDNDRDGDVEGGVCVKVSMIIRNCMRSLYYGCGDEIMMI